MRNRSSALSLNRVRPAVRFVLLPSKRKPLQKPCHLYVTKSGVFGVSDCSSNLETPVAQIEFLEWTESDHLRHSKFVGLRDDKDPRSVVKEHTHES
jgi:hypothetical protein